MREALLTCPWLLARRGDPDLAVLGIYEIGYEVHLSALQVQTDPWDGAEACDYVNVIAVRYRTVGVEEFLVWDDADN
jgi:hypothetical protein